MSELGLALYRAEKQIKQTLEKILTVQYLNDTQTNLDIVAQQILKSLK